MKFGESLVPEFIPLNAIIETRTEKLNIIKKGFGSLKTFLLIVKIKGISNKPINDNSLNIIIDFIKT